METQTETTVLIGLVSVDSGQLIVGDPCYIGGDFGDEEFAPSAPNDQGYYPHTYNGACGATLSDKGYGELAFSAGHGGAGVAFRSGLGDGTYPVYATIVDDPVWGKRVARVEIVMMEEGDC